jgi:uncharacterized protein
MDEPSFVTCKIILHSAWGSGKTTFIKTISEINIVSTEKGISKASKKAEVKENTTVAMDFGRITSEDQTVILYVFALPGSSHVWMDLIEGALGFILIVDSRYPETFRQTRSMFQTLMAYSPLPIVIAANFQDLPDAWDVEALRIGLQVSNDIPIIPCVATDRESVKGVLIALLNEVLKDIEAQSK